jgi:hypothetical protein
VENFENFPSQNRKIEKRSRRLLSLKENICKSPVRRTYFVFLPSFSAFIYISKEEKSENSFTLEELIGRQSESDEKRFVTFGS